MHKQIFVNLPVKDIGKTRAFFAGLGFTFNPQFSDERALCMIIGENIYAMLLQEAYFQTFTKKPVADARTSTEVLTCLSCDSREQVDSMVAKAVAGGGRAPNEKQDHGFMYYHSFEDLDGHGWELMYMDPNAVPPQA
ncbi:VOC family protein [Massilia sp. YIM B02769]|uniref:VOC family protein n=1 Tax=unclassified Massilia TaxID=2609279 RepID=UPI0025B68CC6|nr:MULTISPECIES: VOC family protein [unclassified Massilia]MDN4058476.1 VOC family protein [Massilia sp. YIM B02769]